MMYFNDLAIVESTVSPSTTHIEPSPDGAVLIGRLLSITKSVRALTALHLAGIGLNIGQDQFLDVLGDEKAMAVSEVAIALNVRPSTVSKMTDRMVEKGLVDRIEDDGDCRRTLLRLTTVGAEMRGKVHAVWRRLEEQLVQHDRSLVGQDVAAALDVVDAALTGRLSRLR